MASYEFFKEYEAFCAAKSASASYEGFRDRFLELLPKNYRSLTGSLRTAAREAALKLRLEMTREQEIDFLRGAWRPRVESPTS